MINSQRMNRFTSQRRHRESFIVEGYISIRNVNIDRIVNLLDKQVEICVFKLYPLLLKS